MFLSMARVKITHPFVYFVVWKHSFCHCCKIEDGLGSLARYIIVATTPSQMGA